MKATGYLAFLRQETRFRHLWLGDVTSFFGNWFNLIAVYTSVQALTSSPMAIAIVVFAKTFPSFLMVPLAGPIVDRFERRRLLITCNIARALCVMGLIVSHLAHWLGGLYFFTFVLVCFTGVSFPTKRAVLPMVVKRENIGMANAIGGGTWSVMLAFGAALGGVAVSQIGIVGALLCDVATYLLSCAFYARLPRLEPPVRTREETRFVEGLRYLARTPYVMALTSLKPLMACSTSVVLVIVPIYGLERFAASGHSGPLYVGLLYACRGAGATLGSLVPRLLFGEALATMRRWIAFGFLVIAASLSLVAHAGSIYGAFTGFFLSAIGSGIVWVLSGTLITLEGDERYHGRVFSLEFGVTTLVFALGGLAVGQFQEWGASAAEVTQQWALLALFGFGMWSAVLAFGRVSRRGVESAREPAPEP